MRHAGCRLRGSYPQKGIAPRNRMRENFTSGSVGRAPGNRCLYPEADAKSRAADLSVRFLNHFDIKTCFLARLAV